MQKLTLAALSAAAVFTLAGCDRANDTAQVAQAPRPTFESVDKNGDGRITTQEALDAPGLDFARLDADKNQSISRDEFNSATALRPRG